MNYSLTETDNGRVLELQVKQQLELALPESRMSGYQWTILESGEPFLAHSEIRTQSKPSLVGQPNVRAWQFTAQQPGLALVMLRHARSWEPAASAREFSFSVKVSG